MAWGRLVREVEDELVQPQVTRLAGYLCGRLCPHVSISKDLPTARIVTGKGETNDATVRIQSGRRLAQSLSQEIPQRVVTFCVCRVDLEVQELDNRGWHLLDLDRFANRYESGRFRTCFSNVAPLRCPGHDDPWCVGVNLSAVHVAECPIVEAGLYKVVQRAGGIGIMPFSADQGCVEHRDIHRAFDRSGKLGQKACGGVAIRETHAVNPDIVGELDLAAAPIEDMDIFGPDEFAGQGVFGIVIAFDVEDFNTAHTQSIQLIGQECGCSSAPLRAIEEITGYQECGYALVKCCVHNSGERSPGGSLNLIPQPGVTQRERSHWRVEVDVRSVKDLDHLLGRVPIRQLLVVPVDGR